MRNLAIILLVLIALVSCVVYVPGFLITQGVSSASVEVTDLARYGEARSEFNGVVAGSIADHFPASLPAPPASCELYAADHPLQGGMELVLLVRTTPAEAALEIARLTPLHQPPSINRDQRLQISLDRFALTSSVSAQGTVMLTLAQPDNHAGLFWADPATGEMVYAAFVD